VRKRRGDEMRREEEKREIRAKVEERKWKADEPSLCKYPKTTIHE